MSVSFENWVKCCGGEYARHFIQNFDNYESRKQLHKSAIEFVRSAQIEDYDKDRLEALYILLTDTFVEESILNALPNNEHLLIFLAEQVVSTQHEEIRGQFAQRLGNVVQCKESAERILLLLVNDNDEYTSRMALLSLAELNSVETEDLAEKAWKSGAAYQRIACLWALKKVNSKKLSSYVALALIDGRLFLVKNALEILANA
jgi:hypothetical protein